MEDEEKADTSVEGWTRLRQSEKAEIWRKVTTGVAVHLIKVSLVCLPTPISLWQGFELSFALHVTSSELVRKQNTVAYIRFRIVLALY